MSYRARRTDIVCRRWSFRARMFGIVDWKHIRQQHMGFHIRYFHRKHHHRTPLLCRSGNSHIRHSRRVDFFRSVEYNDISFDRLVLPYCAIVIFWKLRDCSDAAARRPSSADTFGIVGTFANSIVDSRLSRKNFQPPSATMTRQDK